MPKNGKPFLMKIWSRYKLIKYEKKIFYTFWIIILLFYTSCQNGTDSFDKNSELSNVYGRLTVETFYGPPGYGEDPINDSKEDHCILVLEDEPLGSLFRK